MSDNQEKVQTRLADTRRTMGAHPTAAPATEAPPARVPAAPGRGSEGDGCHLLRALHRLPVECAERDGPLFQ